MLISDFSDWSNMKEFRVTVDNARAFEFLDYIHLISVLIKFVFGKTFIT